MKVIIVILLSMSSLLFSQGIERGSIGYLNTQNANFEESNLDISKLDLKTLNQIKDELSLIKAKVIDYQEEFYIFHDNYIFDIPVYIGITRNQFNQPIYDVVSSLNDLNTNTFEVIECSFIFSSNTYHELSNCRMQFFKRRSKFVKEGTERPGI